MCEDAEISEARTFVETLVPRRQPNDRASVGELLEIAGRAAEQVKQPVIDHAELLYGEQGLPK